MAISSILQLPSRWTKLKLEQMKSERRNSYIKNGKKTILFSNVFGQKFTQAPTTSMGFWMVSRKAMISLLRSCKNNIQFFFKGSQKHHIPLYREAQFPLLEILHERPGLLVVLLFHEKNIVCLFVL